MIPQRLRRFLRLQRLSAGLVGLTFGVLISILANWLSDQWARYIPIAERIGLSPQELVVDVTTGIRSMALGATLACLDAEHTIEFVGTAYDNSGNPAGPLYPIIFNFEALPGQ